MNIVAHVPEYLVNQYRHHVNISNRWHQTNEFTTMVRSPINFVLGYCIAAAPDPAWDYWCANCSIETQAI